MPNTPALSWRPVLLMEEIGVYRENVDLAQFTSKLLLRLYQVDLAIGENRAHNFSGDRQLLQR